MAEAAKAIYLEQAISIKHITETVKLMRDKHQEWVLTIRSLEQEVVRNNYSTTNIKIK